MFRILQTSLRRFSSKNNKDVFGALGVSKATLDKDLDLDVLDDDGVAEYEAKIADTSRPRPHEFLRTLNAQARQRDLASALKTLEVDMRKEVVKPKEKHFRVVINECAKQGFVTKVSSIFIT